MKQLVGKILSILLIKNIIKRGLIAITHDRVSLKFTYFKNCAPLSWDYDSNTQLFLSFRCFQAQKPFHKYNKCPLLILA